MLRNNSDSISKPLCKINAKNAISHVPEDRERIFKAIESVPGGFQTFNVNVMDLIREWFVS